MPSTVIAFCRSANINPRFFDAFKAARNWPWLRKPALACSSVMPSGSIGVTFANWAGFPFTLIETLLGVVGNGVGVVVTVTVVVVGVVVLVAVVVPLPVVDAFVVVGAVPAFLAAPSPLPLFLGAEAVVVVGALVVAPDAVDGAEAFGPPAFGFFAPPLLPWVTGAALVVFGAPPLGAFPDLPCANKGAVPSAKTAAAIARDV